MSNDSGDKSLHELLIRIDLLEKDTTNLQRIVKEQAQNLIYVCEENKRLKDSIKRSAHVVGKISKISILS